MHATRTLALALLLALAGTASAQTLPRPVEFYFDEDAATTEPLAAPAALDEASVQRLLRSAGRDSRARAELARVAHVAMAEGRTDLGRSLYQRALAGLDAVSNLSRPLHWHYGWDLYRAGDHAAALEHWATSARRGSPAWVPPTFALGLWKLGRREEAVQWYAAAVRTEPQRWNDARNLPKLLPGWRDDERATLAEVHAAWAANPPAWR